LLAMLAHVATLLPFTHSSIVARTPSLQGVE
jgi:hypothetical protein